MTKPIKYKETGLEWCPQIPEHWELKKLKYLGEAIIGITYSPEDVVDSDEKGMLVLRASNIQKGKLTFDDNVYVKKDIDIKYLTQEGDILICARNGSPHLVGKCAFVTSDYKELTFGAFMLIYRSNFGNYAYRIFNSNLFRCQVGLFKTVTINQLTTGTINNMYVPLPPPTEQQKIADYLDHKTSLIDSIISKKEKQIELYKEERTAVINHAVTKGLNPHVEMKDSGIEWLGSIPKHWSYSKLKFITRKIVDGTHFTPVYQEKGIPFLRVTDIQCEEIQLNKVKYISEEESEELNKRCNPERGDILLSKNGTIGITKVINWDWNFSIFVSLCLIKVTKKLDPYYCSYFFKTHITDQQILEGSRKTSVTNLHLEMIKELIISLPNISEQQEIVSYLDNETNRIDTLVSKTSKQIELLKEYKEALINEVVTGQRIIH